MADQAPQSFANHARIVPMYHYVAFLLITIYLGWTIAHLARQPGFESFAHAAGAVGLVLIFLYARNFALTAQDRVIRLEETLRMQRLLPPELQARIGELTRGQFVALRFASDAELPELVRRTLAGEFATPKAIKQAIVTWRPDHLRV